MSGLSNKGEGVYSSKDNGDVYEQKDKDVPTSSEGNFSNANNDVPDLRNRVEPGSKSKNASNAGYDDVLLHSGENVSCLILGPELGMFCYCLLILC